jgi:hypothetical protein
MTPLSQRLLPPSNTACEKASCWLGFESYLLKHMARLTSLMHLLCAGWKFLTAVLFACI